MNVLILGGTAFVGRHIVQAFLDADHTVMIFTRGKTNSYLFPEVGRLIGDRDTDLRSVENAVRARTAAGGGYDGCIDVSGYTLAQVERSLDAVADYVGRYLFISSVGVYRRPVPENFREDTPVEEIDDPHAAFSLQSYGGLKVVCERAVQERMGDRGVSFRLGLVAGPWDYTDRATYWCVRALDGGEIFVPASPDTPFQIVDGRDVGIAAVHALTTGLSGAYNVVKEPTTWKAWLDMSARSRAAEHTPVSVPNCVFADDQAWVEQQVSAISDPRPSGPLPMFLPSTEGWNLWKASNETSLVAGVTYRSHQETIDDTLSWRLRETPEIQAGLTAEQERQLIAAWRKRVGNRDNG